MTRTRPGSATPTSPLVSTATPIATQQPSIQPRRALAEAAGCCASSMQASTQAMTPASVMSRVLKCAATLHIGAASRASPAKAAARAPNQRHVASIDMTMPASPASATQSRACHSPTPHSAYVSAVTHMWNGGFSKYFSAL
ncbi:hypothetical protein D3C87_1180150 [compost metagenome]